MFAVLQLRIDPPPLEGLANAFRASRVMAVADAPRVVLHGSGFIRENLQQDAAEQLHAALAAEGIESVVVAQADIPPLPPKKSAPRLDCREEALLIYDVMGRARSVTWDAIAIAAVGAVSRIKHEARIVHRAGRGDAEPGLNEKEYEEKQEQRPTLGLAIRNDGHVYVIETETLLYTPAGADKPSSRKPGLTPFLLDVTKRASGAALNRGARSLQESPRHLIRYPSRRVFEQELRWLLWMNRRPAR